MRSLAEDVLQTARRASWHCTGFKRFRRERKNHADGEPDVRAIIDRCTVTQLVFIPRTSKI